MNAFSHPLAVRADELTLREVRAGWRFIVGPELAKATFVRSIRATGSVIIDVCPSKTPKHYEAIRRELAAVLPSHVDGIQVSRLLLRRRHGRSAAWQRSVTQSLMIKVL